MENNVQKNINIDQFRFRPRWQDETCSDHNIIRILDYEGLRKNQKPKLVQKLTDYNFTMQCSVVYKQNYCIGHEKL